MQKSLEEFNSERFLCFRISLVINDPFYTGDEISKFLGIQPSVTCEKQNSVEKESTVWCYTINIDDKTEFSEKSELFFKKITDKLEKIKKFKDVIIKLHIHAALAQVYFEVPGEFVSRVDNCKIPFVLSIFDWGGVEDV